MQLHFDGACKIIKPKRMDDIMIITSNYAVTGRVDTSVTGRTPHRIPDMRLSRIRLFTKLIVHQLSIDTDIDFRTCQWICIVNHFQVARPRVTPFLTSSIKPVKETFKHLISKGG